MYRTAIVVLAMVLFVTTVRVAAQQDSVRVYSQQGNEDGPPQHYNIYADNDYPLPIYLVISVQHSANLSPTVALPHKQLLAAGRQNRLLFSIIINDPYQQGSFTISSTYALGDPYNVRHEETKPYLFPFAHGTKQRVSQGPGGSYTHFGENNYALDFDLSPGTPIYAAREGLVVDIKKDSKIGGTDLRYAAHGNYILIYHDDGTFGHYVHLQFNGVIVELYQRVNTGQHIGYSGDTGRSSGPHLHFDVRLPTEEGVMQSVPITFFDHNQEVISPTEGNYYYAFHPDGQPFEPQFGADLTVADFAGYSAPATVTQGIDFRTEQIDSTIVAYLSNGHSRNLSAEISFTLRGVVSDMEYPQQIILPAEQEIFVGLFRLLPDTQQALISPQFRVTDQ